jgi:hypothetical protein
MGTPFESAPEGARASGSVPLMTECPAQSPNLSRLLVGPPDAAWVTRSGKTAAWASVLSPDSLQIEISLGRKLRPIVEALLDSEGTVLDENRNPLSLEAARASVNRVQQNYREQAKAVPDATAGGR